MNHLSAKGAADFGKESKSLEGGSVKSGYVINHERLHQMEEELLVRQRRLGEFGNFSNWGRESDIKVADRRLGGLEKLVLKTGRVVGCGIRFYTSAIRTSPARDRDMATQTGICREIEETPFTAETPEELRLGSVPLEEF